MPVLRASAVKGEAGGGHVVLLGDSIFDNAAYVSGGPDVVIQLGALIPRGWKATLKAVDGARTLDVANQLAGLPSDTTHLIVSVGGNDALMQKPLLEEKASSVAEVLTKLARIRDEFHANYRSMLDGVLDLKRPSAVCTIYDANYPEPQLREIANAGLTIFNDVITREAATHRIPIIDLRVIFNSEADYANPVEPSVIGGEKIARAVAKFVTSHVGSLCSWSG
jgi:hypothetical protein